MAQTKTIQLLRSSAVYANLEAAKSGIQSAAGTRQDGELLLGRYWSGTGANAVIKSVIGIYHKSPDLVAGENETITAGWTFIQDITSSSEGLKQLQDEVDAIESNVGLGTDGSYTGHAAGSEIVGETTTLNATVEAIISYLQGLDKTASAVDGQVVTTVTQTNGAVTETKANVKDLQLGGYSKDTSATGAIGSTDTVNTALSKLENNIAANDTARTVSSSDQSITVANSANGTDVIVNVDNTTIVKDGISHAIKGNYTLHQLNSTELAALNDANVKEAYRLQTIGGSAEIGDVVKVYKDSALQEVYLGANTDTIDASTGVITKNTVTDPQSMNFAYQLANGTYSLTKIDVSKFLTQSEFGDGLQVSGAGVVSVKVGNGLEINSTSKAVDVKIDSTSETFLTVGANGVKLSGVQGAIDTAKATIDNYTVNGKKISTNPVLDGSDINVDDTATTKETVKAAIARLDAAAAGAKTIVAEGTDTGNNMTIQKTTDTTTKADTYTISLTGIAQDSEVVKSVNTKTPTNGAVTVGGGDIALTGYSKGSSADPVAAADTVNAAIGKLENQIDAAKAAATAVEHANGNTHVTVTSSTDTTTGKVTYTVNETNIADADDLTAEIAARKAVDGQSGDTYAANSNANYISGATSLNNADVLLDTALKAADDAMLTQINGSDAIDVTTKASKQQTVSLKLDTTTATGNITSDMLQITSNGLMMKDTWDCGVF